jgi:hypothetical protein
LLLKHLGRIPEDSLSKTIMDYQPPGRRNIGKPCKLSRETRTDLWPALEEQKENKIYCCVSNIHITGEISGSHGEYEDYFLLGCCTM